MFNNHHPAKAARIISTGLTTSTLLGLISVFTWNQVAADLSAINTNQAVETPVTTNLVGGSKSVAPATAPASSSVVPSTTDPNVASATSQVAPAAPVAADVAVVTAPVVTAPVANTTTSGSK